jgi:hypothetical protein
MEVCEYGPKSLVFSRFANVNVTFPGLRRFVQVWSQRHLRSGHEVAGGRVGGRQSHFRPPREREIRREELIQSVQKCLWIR